MNNTEAAAAIATALDRVHAVYWSACASAEAAVDPTDLGAPDSVLDAAFDSALRIEEIARSQGITWAEAVDFL